MSKEGYLADIPEKEEKKEVDLPLTFKHQYLVKLQGADLLAIAFLAGVLYAIIVFKIMD